MFTNKDNIKTREIKVLRPRTKTTANIPDTSDVPDSLPLDSSPDIINPATFGASFSVFGDSLPDVCSQLDHAAPLPSIASGDYEQRSQLFQAKFEQIDKRFTQLEHLTRKNLELEAALASANIKIRQLEIQLQQNADPEMISSPAPGNFKVPATFNWTLGSQASKYASVAASNQKRDPTPREALELSARSACKTKAASNKPMRITAKVFSVPVSHDLPSISDEDGKYAPMFKCVYLPKKYRDCLSTMRNKLHKLGATSGRLLDIHYPARGVVAVLIHVGYYNEFTNLLEKWKIAPLLDFNPLDHHHLRDLKLLEILTSDEERTTKLKEISSQTNTIFCGDFNARHIQILGDSLASPRGTRVFDWEVAPDDYDRFILQESETKAITRGLRSYKLDM